ncbi:TPA: hypothetical protein ACH3X1_014827 [Trebouxia sp. C0004]
MRELLADNSEALFGDEMHVKHSGQIQGLHAFGLQQRRLQSTTIGRRQGASWPCCEEAALETEDWVISLAELLSSRIWSESTVVIKALLKRLQNLVEQIGEGKSGAAHHELFRLNSPQRRRLELMLTEYLNRFIVRIRDNELYVVKQLQHGNTVLDDFAFYCFRQHSRPAHGPSQSGSTAQPSQSSSALQANLTERGLPLKSSNC